MLRPFKIPPLLLLGAVMFLVAGELACGTGIYWVTMMAITMLCIGVTYNLLGGLSTIGGIAFAGLGLWTIGISQVAKVILRQPADKIIVAPNLTITVYAVFYFAAMVGASFFCRIPLSLPHPREPESRMESRRLYWIAFAIGMIGLVIFNVTTMAYGATQQGLAQQETSEHSIGVALEALVLFSEVFAIDERIASTEGRHSFSLRVLIPVLAVAITGMINTERREIVAPIALYFLSCYTRGFRFRRRHFVLGGGFLIGFSLFVSPLSQFLRPDIAGLDWSDRVHVAEYVIENLDWKEVESISDRLSKGSMEYEDYYNLPGMAVLNRFSRIRNDSNLIRAGESFHYGFTGIENDLLLNVPHFIYRNKPMYSSADYLGRVSGQNAGDTGVAAPAYSMISDSFGAFGWMGVVVFGLVMVPCTIALYEGMFDMSRPWGTIALLTLVTLMSEGSAGALVANVMFRTPVFLFTLSYLVGVLARLGPVEIRQSAPPAAEVGLSG